MVLVGGRGNIGRGIFIILSAMILNPWRVFLSVGVVVTLAHASASDWPQFLGPTRNGVYSGSTLAASWPKDGPRVVWQRKVGQGFSGPAVASDKLVLFHRIDDKETVECLDAKTGKALWSFDYPTVS
jgi:outer membrane protein assembly factor BamB